MMKKKIILYSILSLLLSTITISIFIYTNKNIRTAIFRTLVKGNWYITSEKDTLYSFGYYGVQKWLIEKNNKLKKLAENKSFCNNP